MSRKPSSVTPKKAPNILLANRSMAANLVEVGEQSKQFHEKVKQAVADRNYKFGCHSIYDLSQNSVGLEQAIFDASLDQTFTHVIVSSDDADGQRLFPGILEKLDAGFILLQPSQNPVEQLRITGADFSISDFYMEKTGNKIPFEKAVADVLDILVKRIMNGYHINDKLYSSVKGRFRRHIGYKNYQFSKNRHFGWLK